LTAGGYPPGVELDQPTGDLTQPVHLIIEAIGDQLAAGQFDILAGMRVFGSGPAHLPQLAEQSASSW